VQYRQLGKTGLKVSEIGYGTWMIANNRNLWVGADLDESLRSLHKFAELPARKGVPIDEVFPPEHMVRCVDDSLRSLGLDAIDIVQFHVWQDEYAGRDEWKETAVKLSEQGEVKFWGISVNDNQPTNCLKALGTGLISTLQFIFNIFHQRPADKLLPFAREHGTGLIARVTH
jgi:aryl-alcohol dehydrogenase-like predicted oxidoreductase